MEASVRVRGNLIFISTVIFYFVFNFVSLQGYIQPSISLTSCNHKTASLRISNTTTGGLLYIRTDTFYNVESTVDGEMTYDCAFEDCNIQWVQFAPTPILKRDVGMTI
ncbi:hypothetical protein DPMN_180887 [Dreissena polymorpha]|uniref:Uncharacterized protein n=1 Tax=Dreissena polymorpha TaxID=45954 RepID=A0A9D4DF58_DREPO|nr:hypothetical protein DPMN_180887 [Dreissena polymorpha]